MSTATLDAPPAVAEKSNADGHFYGYCNETGKWFPLYAEGETFRLGAARAMHAKGHIVVPSVTGVIGVMRKYQIEEYQKKAAAKAGRDTPMADYDSEDAWLKHCLAVADSASRGAMDLGTRVHKASENCIIGQDYDADMAKYVLPLHECIAQYGMATGISAEECAGSQRHGVAGKFDIIHEGTMTCGDIKTRGHKLNKVKPSRVPYYETDLMQVAAGGFFKWGNRFFQEGRGIVFGVSTVQPGLVTPHVFTGKELVEPFSTFLALTQVWRYINNFDPRVKA